MYGFPLPQRGRHVASLSGLSSRNIGKGLQGVVSVQDAINSLKRLPVSLLSDPLPA